MDESIATRGGGRASSVGPDCGCESGMRSLEAEDGKAGTGGRRGGVCSSDGGAFSLLLFACEFTSCEG